MKKNAWLCLAVAAVWGLAMVRPVCLLGTFSKKSAIGTITHLSKGKVLVEAGDLVMVLFKKKSRLSAQNWQGMHHPLC